MGALFLATGCGELPESFTPPEDQPLDFAQIVLHSTLSCSIDTDCDAGLHCFQSICSSACVTDDDCGSKSVCTERKRCVSNVDANDDESIGRTSVDQSRQGEFVEDQSGRTVLAWPNERQRVEPETRELTLQIELDAPPTNGVLLYTWTYHHTSESTPVMQATGGRILDLVLPLPENRPPILGVDLTTSVGKHSIYIMDTPLVSGVYEGSAVPRELGGSALPVEFAIETLPRSAADLSSADERYLWVSTDHAYLLSLPTANATTEWLRAPLAWDNVAKAWVASLSTPVRSAAFFGENLYPNALRTLRIELRENPDDPQRFDGAFTDRWHGLHERRSVDGIAEQGIATISATLSVGRVGSPTLRDVADSPLIPPTSAPINTPNLSVCTADMLARSVTVPPGSNPDTYPRPCGHAQHGATIADLDTEQQAECGLALTELAFESETVGERLRAYLDPSLPNPGGISFEAFLDDCARDLSSLCRPAPEVACARNVVATAYRAVSGASPYVADLAEAFDALTREQFVGTKLAAFQIDTAKRIEWLRSSEAPLFLSSALRDYNASLLREWKAGVLEPQIAVTSGQLDAAGMAVLSRSTTNPWAMSYRNDAILEIANSWRVTAESLTLYVQRQNVMEQNATKRAALAAEAQQTAFRLYLSAALLADIARDSGNLTHVASFGPHLSAVMGEARRLRQSFSSLIFARDAEVVTATSVDPTTNARSLLGELHADAIQAIEQAQQSVNFVLDEAANRELNEAELLRRYEDKLLATRNELIELCGLKRGCLASEVGTHLECDIPVASNACGFDLARGENSAKLDTGVSVSEAGRALLQMQAADAALEALRQRQQAAITEINVLADTAEGFATMLQSHHEKRNATHRQTQRLLNEIHALNQSYSAQALGTLQEQQRIREQAYIDQAAAVAEWQQIIVRGSIQDISTLSKMRSALTTAQILHQSANVVSNTMDAFADSFSTESTSFHGVKLIPLAPALIVNTALSSAAVNQEIQATNLELSMEEGYDELQFEIELQDLAQLDYATTIQRIQGDLEAERIRTDAERSTLTALIDILIDQQAIDEKYARDLHALRDRRDALRIQALAYERLSYDLVQAELTVQQRLMAFLEIAQRAQILSANFSALNARWSNIENLLGSPDVIFSFYQQMNLAESRLNVARRAMENWIVALEYYAVRPFVDQRMAVLLARNPQQLEAIAHELTRLQSVCGGPITEGMLDISVRDNLLGAGFSSQTADGKTLSPGERFRAMLERAQSPVSKSTRISTQETLGERLARGNVWALSFQLDIERFANLNQSCNARNHSMAIRLVGLEETDVLPAITILYDGNSVQRSCQPNMRELIQAIGPNATAFNTLTRFRTGARSMTPLAGIENFGPERSWSATLEGTPLAAGYTILIDREHPSNKAIDWNQLEDIRLLIRYDYQDNFVPGQCE